MATSREKALFSDLLFTQAAHEGIHIKDGENIYLNRGVLGRHRPDFLLTKGDRVRIVECCTTVERVKSASIKYTPTTVPYLNATFGVDKWEAIFVLLQSP